MHNPLEILETGELVFPDPEDPHHVIDRRQFLALGAASAALAGVFGCSPTPAPRDEIVPYVRNPQGLKPGTPLTFATAMGLGGSAVGLLVTSREGRPVKVEGNPDHPGSLGSTDLYSQAALLGLYDPDRSQSVLRREVPSTWDAALLALRAALKSQKSRRGSGVRILSGAINSPTLAAQRDAFLTQYPGAQWICYEPINPVAALRGSELAFGEPVQAVYDFSRADVVLSLDADFLDCVPGTVRYQRDFADRRRIRSEADAGHKIAGGTNRLYSVECMLTTTGANADHRLALKAGEIESFGRALALELKLAGTPPIGPLPEGAQAWLTPLARDLISHKGRGVVVVGDNQPASLHALGNALNVHLGNMGTTVRFIEPFERAVGGGTEGLRKLVEEMSSGEVEFLLVFGSNPVYTAPADLRFSDALRKVKTTFHLGVHHDETALMCEWHLPESHLFESWGDARGFDGTATIQQPLIQPLYNGKSALELVSALVGDEEPRGLDLVREHWRKARPDEPNFDQFWERSVQLGRIEDTASASKSVAIRPDWSRESGLPTSEGLEINFRPDPVLYDGRFNNNGWLQELPKPITKLTWGNAAIMGPETARDLGITMRDEAGGGQHGHLHTDEVELRYKNRSLRIPAFVQPGHSEGAVTLHLGHGRLRAGRVGTGIGVDANRLRTSDAPWFGPGLRVSKTGERVDLACTQAHHSMEDRHPVRYGTASDFRHDPHSLIPQPESLIEGAAVTAMHTTDTPLASPSERDGRLLPTTLYPEWPYEGRRWAMTIDLSTCTGCSVCVVACQSENNIPVVGKKQVIAGREMHWIRIDEYHEGENHYAQPVPCMQCEKAPCEVVCPVGATVHSADGLNDMTYNRCVGTRYCSNNCPYKVRRFNFLDYSAFAEESMKPLHNPEVTVRSRGVMEKCTYCVQRIRNGEHDAEIAGKPLVDGEIRTACQQACPSRAIHFGDWNDPASEVRATKNQPHNYALLAELNTQPRTTYLAAVRNPNPEMPGGSQGA